MEIKAVANNDVRWLVARMQSAGYSLMCELTDISEDEDMHPDEANDYREEIVPSFKALREVIEAITAKIKVNEEHPSANLALMTPMQYSLIKAYLDTVKESGTLPYSVGEDIKRLYEF